MQKSGLIPSGHLKVSKAGRSYLFTNASYVSYIIFHPTTTCSLIWCLTSKMQMGSLVIRNVSFGTCTPKQSMSNSTWILMGNCQSLMAVNLNRDYASVLLVLDGLIIGFRYFSNRDWCSNVISLAKSNKLVSSCTHIKYLVVTFSNCMLDHLNICLHWKKLHYLSPAPSLPPACWVTYRSLLCGQYPYKTCKKCWI